MFAPAGFETDRATLYLRRFGFRTVGGGILTRSYDGTIGAAQRAFHTRLGSYRARGVTFRAPLGRVRVPAQIGADLTSVDGLDTYPAIRPADRTAAASSVVTPTCSGPGAVHSQSGGYLPAVFAASSAYDFQSLLDGGATGHGDALGLVEFSGYTPSDVAAYQSCFGTSVPITDVTVNAGTSSHTGAGEVALDEEIAATSAPGLDDIYTYIAPNNQGFTPVLDQIISDQPTTGVTEISISWGICEALANPSDMASSDAEFQLAAAAGVSVFAASGDYGAADCYPNNGSTALAVNYPASSPYVTGVGGTTLSTSLSGASHETTWGTPSTPSGGGGGGGVSIAYPMPSWQSAAGVVESGYSSMDACGQTTVYCREVPDVALDSNPDTGYIIYCSDPYCGAGWMQVGGTSAATPLLAAMTADANSYSVAHNGSRLGFANPFFYHHAGGPVFHDVTLGSNSILGSPTYPAAGGYDMASGLGSPDGNAYAAALLADTGPPQPDSTTITATPSSSALSSSNLLVFLSGTLTDTTTSQPLANRTVVVDGAYYYHGTIQTLQRSLTTNASGGWQTILIMGDVKARMLWGASYDGEPGIASSVSPTSTLYIGPILTTKANLHRSKGHYVVRHGKTFTLSGTAEPAMPGEKVVVQYRNYGSHRWYQTTITAKVNASGGYATRLHFTGTGRKYKIYLRFAYHGSTTGQWISATARSRLFVVT